MFSFSFEVTRIYKQRVMGRVGINQVWSHHDIEKTVSLDDSKIPLLHVTNDVEKEAPRILNQRYHLTPRFPRTSLPLIKGGRESHVHHNQWLVTGVYSSLNYPLFYRHELPLTVDEDLLEVSVGGRVVPPTEWKVLDEVDLEDPSHDVIRKVLAHSQEEMGLLSYKEGGARKTVLLDTQPLFKKANHLAVEDHPDLLIYFINELHDGFSIHLPGTSFSSHALKEKDVLLRASIEKHTFSNEPWFPVIPNYQWKDARNHWKINEYLGQIFTSFPLMAVKRDTTKILGKHLVRASRRGIQASEEIVLTLWKDQKVQKILTTDESRDEEWDPQRRISLTFDETISCSAKDSLIRSEAEDFTQWDRVDADFIIDCDDYTLDINLNPFWDKSLVGKTFSTWLAPHEEGKPGLHWILFDEDNVITEASAQLSSWVGEFYRLPDPAQESTLSFYFATNVQSFIEEMDSWICLGEFSIPENLREVRDSWITDVREINWKSVDELRNADQFEALAFYEETWAKDSFPLAFMNDAHLFLVHWKHLKDWNSDAVFYKDEAEEELRKILPAGRRPRIILDGVPELRFQTPETLDEFMVSWERITGHDEVISGTLYQGETLETMAAHEFIADLSKRVDSTFDSSVQKEFYIQMRLTDGPSSNLLKIILS